MSKTIQALLEELLEEKGFGSFGLTVSEEEGRVHISGSVPRWDQVVQAGHLAGTLQGVKSIVNEITPQEPLPPPYHAPEGNPSIIDSVDVVVIGAGVVGSAIARELSRYNLRLAIVEKEADVGCGASKANNGMVHSGIVQEPYSLRSDLNVKGNAMFEELCAELDVPFRRCGLIGVILKEEELFLLDLIKARGESAGIPVEVLTREQALALEPTLSPETMGAFLAPTTAMTSPYKLTVAYAENAVMNGAELYLETEVTGIEQQGGRVHKVITSRGTFLTRFCINVAGIYADRVAELAGSPEFTLHPRKGELIIFDSQSAARHTAMATGVLALGQDPYTKGGGTMFTVDGNPEWGPTAYEVPDREDTAVTREGIDRVIDKFNPLIPGFNPRTAIINYFAGVRAATYTEDFYIAPSRHLGGLVHVAGIQSPGLVAAPAIAGYVLDILREQGLALQEKKSFDPIRRGLTYFKMLDQARQDELIRKDARYGKIVCRCEHISEGEIVEALHRPVPALNLDAVKRRTRAGMGRCQGGFCMPRVLLIMSRELGIPLEKLTKSGSGSLLFSRRTKTPAPRKKEWWVHG
jgi:glycerol-3-phosphate dehydrogenase